MRSASSNDGRRLQPEEKVDWIDNLPLLNETPEERLEEGMAVDAVEVRRLPHAVEIDERQLPPPKLLRPCALPARKHWAMRCALLCVGESDSRREGLSGSEAAVFSVVSEDASSESKKGTLHCTKPYLTGGSAAVASISCGR